jgi:hypothetical protein
MDMDALKEAVKTTIRKLTPEMQLDAGELFNLIAKHGPALEKLGPEVLPVLMPHVQTAAVEFAMGTIDKAKLDTTLREAFAECGLPSVLEPITKT